MKKNTHKKGDVIVITEDKWKQEQKKYDLSNAHVTMDGTLDKPTVTIEFL